MSSEIMVPFQLDSTGQVAVVTDPDTQIAQHVMSLVSTQPGERTVIADYGCGLASLLFEQESSVLTDAAQDITMAFAQWEPGVVLTTVAPSPNNSWQGDEVNIQVGYMRADSAKVIAPGAPPSSNYAIIQVGGHVTETVRG